MINTKLLVCLFINLLPKVDDLFCSYMSSNSAKLTDLKGRLLSK